MLVVSLVSIDSMPEIISTDREMLFGSLNVSASLACKYLSTFRSVRVPIISETAHALDSLSSDFRLTLYNKIIHK